MKERQAYRTLGCILFVLGLLFIFSNRPEINSLTGNVVGSIGNLDGSPTLTYVLGFALLAIAIIIFIAEEKESVALEEKVDKLVVKDIKTGKVFFLDQKYIISHELNHSVGGKRAEEVLSELRREFGSTREFKELMQEMFRENNYFKAAYSQRDSCAGLVPGSEGYYADLFLKEWDPQYKEFVSQKNRYLLSCDDPKIEKTGIAEIYDTRKVLPLMEKNIQGFKVADSNIGSHDVDVTYLGARFRVFAGSKHAYEMPRSGITRALRRIAEEDIKKGNIKKEDEALRIDVLKTYIFE